MIIRLQHGTKEYFARDEFRKNLNLEKQLIDMEGICFTENSEGIEILDIDLDVDVERAYRNIMSTINYLKSFQV